MISNPLLLLQLVFHCQKWKFLGSVSVFYGQLHCSASSYHAVGRLVETIIITSANNTGHSIIQVHSLQNEPCK